MPGYRDLLAQLRAEIEEIDTTSARELSEAVFVDVHPVGAGAIGKGPDAIVLPGYEDVPRPPAFTDATRKLAREQEQAIDNYTPQPAFAGQTRAPKPSKVIPYSVEVFGDPI